MLTENNELLTLEQAAEYLNVSYTWLQRQAAARSVPHTRLGNKHVRFSRTHLEQIIKAGEVDPAAQANARRVRSTARTKL